MLPSVANMLYKKLCMDGSVAQNPITQEKIRLIFLGEPGLVKGLGSLNPGRPNSTYDNFLRLCRPL